MNVLLSIVGVVTNVVTWILSRRKRLDANDKIERDRQLANDIKNGDGKKIAEDFERRKKYGE